MTYSLQHKRMYCLKRVYLYILFTWLHHRTITLQKHREKVVPQNAKKKKSPYYVACYLNTFTSIRNNNRRKLGQTSFFFIIYLELHSCCLFLIFTYRHYCIDTLDTDSEGAILSMRPYEIRTLVCASTNILQQRRKVSCSIAHAFFASGFAALFKQEIHMTVWL